MCQLVACDVARVGNADLDEDFDLAERTKESQEEGQIMNGNTGVLSIIRHFISGLLKHNSTTNLRGSPAAMRVGVSAALLLGLLSLPAFGQVADGFIGGTARDSASGKPVPQVRIIAHNLAGGTDRTAVTDADGMYKFTDLEPGRYDVAATKTGFETASATIDVEGKHLVRVDLPLKDDADAAATTTEPDKQAPSDREKQLQDEIDRLEARLAAMEIKDAAPSAEAKADGTSGSVTASLNPADVPSPEAAVRLKLRQLQLAHRLQPLLRHRVRQRLPQQPIQRRPFLRAFNRRRPLRDRTCKLHLHTEILAG